MANIILMKDFKSPDGSMVQRVHRFLKKLSDDDTHPSLRIKPLEQAVDDRVRTGRVNDDYRAILVRLQGGEDATYVFLGALPHDEANDYASRVRFRMNPVNGVPELEEMVKPRPGSRPEPQPAKPEMHQVADAVQNQIIAPEEETGASKTHYPVMGSLGYTADWLEGLGIHADVAEQAMALRTEEELFEFAEATKPSWQGSLVFSLACGESVPDALEALGLQQPDAQDEGLAEEELASETEADEDTKLLRGLQETAAQLDFALIKPGEEGMAELADVLEGGSFAQWRVFLHPQQRAYAVRSRNGAFRLSGGAGTGKTVVLLHRARHLARKDPNARIVLTTFGKTLAQTLENQLAILDGGLKRGGLGQPGVAIGGVDALVHRVLKEAGEALYEPDGDGVSAVGRILGSRTTKVMGFSDAKMWQTVQRVVQDLPAAATPEFLAAEYAQVVVPNRITTEREYLTVRRPGRGVRLNRSARKAVWQAIASYRAETAADGTTDWHEKAAIAAAYLDQRFGAGVPRPADHVLVDEAQDLTASHLRFLRALVSEGKNDLFLAEDAQQRIYAPKVVLSHYGINIRGRSRRLTLNYRTTAQNLRYAVDVLEGLEFVDLSGEEVSVAGYRSARAGIAPKIVQVGPTDDAFEIGTGLVQAWRNTNQNAEIGILCSYRREAEEWAAALLEQGSDLRVSFLDGQRAAPERDEGFAALVMTMHRAKGMEFNHVIIDARNSQARPGETVDVAEMNAVEEEQITRARSLLYVAATRARDELVVFL